MNYMDDILAKQAYMQQNMPKKDPFDQGIMRAVKSAKQSLDMDDDQSDRAMRESMATFAENIAPMPKVKGFMANFAQVGRALAPALKTHDEYEDQAKEKNKQMIAYAQQLRAAEEAKAAALEGNAYSREMADKQMAFQQQQLAEQREHHKLSLEAARAKAEAKANGKGSIHAKELAKSNIQDLKEQKKSATLAKIRYDILKDFEKVLMGAKEQGLTGTDIIPAARRYYSRYISGDSRELTLNDMLKQAYISRTKELGGSNPSTQEVNLAFATIPGVEKHYGASIEQLNRDIAESLAVIDNYNSFHEEMERTQFQGMPNKIEYGDKARSSKYFDPNYSDKVEMLDDEGVSYNVPREKYNYFLENNILKDAAKVRKEEQATQKEKDESSLFGRKMNIQNTDSYKRNIMPLFDRMR